MRSIHRLGAWCLASVTAVACGSSADGGGDPATGNNGTPGTNSGTPDGGATVTPGTDAGGPTDLPADPIVGLWDVAGTDARGAYEGRVEVRPADDNKAGAYTFIRTVRYPGSIVEGDRELHWLFRGTLTQSGTTYALASSLKRFDFIIKRGATKHTSTDPPIPISGTVTLATPTAKVDIKGDGVLEGDTWSARKALPKDPIWVDERRLVPAHPPPTPQELQTNFQTYASFHELPKVKPYVNRPDFKAAIHYHVFDSTDLSFYRANKNAVRVLEKVVDEVSIAEARARADAYRYTLAEKAELYAQDAVNQFIDPMVHMIPHGGPMGSDALHMWPSGDSALWTAVYLAGMAYRYEVTHDAFALDQVLKTLDALLKLQEITGDWAHFARALRRTGAPNSWGDGWHTGTGQYAGVDWLEGGNNDMVKGLFYGYTVTWAVLCEGGKTGYESYCQRIRTNSKHLADDVEYDSQTSGVTNSLPSNWLYAVVANDPTDQLTYNVKAASYWTAGKTVIAATPVYYNQGICDWSGTHLTSVGDTLEILLAKRANLGGDAENVIRAHIDQSHKNLEKQRFPTWHLLKAAFGTGASPSSPFIKDAILRLQETPRPKMSFDIDRQLAPDFSMDPYPVVPWKNDWTSPTEDRTEGLNSYPLFESGPSINYWMSGNDYASTEGYEMPGGDFLHLYWFARKYGLIGPNE